MAMDYRSKQRFLFPACHPVHQPRCSLAYEQGAIGDCVRFGSELLLEHRLLGRTNEMSTTV